MARRLLIVDDEEPARSRLSRLLGELLPDWEILAAQNGIEALEQISTSQPEIVFLDIQMPGMTGLEVLSQLKQRDFKIIFQTAYDEYALQAFEENACDYLLKPIEKDRLQKSIEKALKLKTQEHRLLELESHFRNKGQYLERLRVKKGNKVLAIDVSTIYSFNSEDHYTILQTQSEEYIIDLPLSHLAERLNPDCFFRCHRSHIVNLGKIESLSLGPNMKINLAGQIQVPVSRQNRQKMKNLLQS